MPGPVQAQRYRPAMSTLVPAVLMVALGCVVAYAGHDVTDSARTIVVVGGWAVAALGLLLAGGGLLLALRGGTGRQ